MSKASDVESVVASYRKDGRHVGALLCCVLPRYLRLMTDRVVQCSMFLNHVVVSPVRDSQGKVIHFVATHQVRAMVLYVRHVRAVG